MAGQQQTASVAGAKRTTMPPGVGERSEVLRRLVDQVKFNRATAGIRDLADMLDKVLPVLPPETTVVPVPTLPSHARIRGHAHVERTAKELARRRGCQHAAVLRRRTKTTQRGASKTKRREQAKRAFAVTHRLDPNRTWVILDDVVTTGATLQYAAKELRSAGATRVVVAAIARQPLDN